MDKKIYWILIFISLAVNVVMLQWTVESYYGEEYTQVWIFSAIGVATSIVSFVTYLFWRKQEY
ncbi:hypothetical protein LC087_16945 [Bacillus carboniphilus]|uniref:Uncharacterized protein n=1 Tax=Bacillus carboniphilus TaxID=86663 RepID=A0ABY9JSJ9_9BACI|nr:hypothetical protein [Bacillus carboniphilus]WLR42371.1 hypothetical protein LC087_16945 [Bacillus carboniphilus]